MLNRIQRQIDLMTRPLLDTQQDYAALTKNLSAALDFPAIRNISKISSAFDSQSMAALYRTQEIVSKIDMSGMVSALQQFQIAIDTVAPMQLQVQLGERIQEWSRVISNSIPYQIEPLTKARVAELTRLTSLAEEYHHFQKIIKLIVRTHIGVHDACNIGFFSLSTHSVPFSRSQFGQ